MKKTLFILSLIFVLVLFGCRHTHKFSEYGYDEEKHYLLCSCGSKKDEELHNISDFIIACEPTNDKSGYKHKVCKICKKEIVREEILKNMSLNEGEFNEKLQKNEILNIDIESLKNDKMYTVKGNYTKNNLQGEYEAILSFDYIRENLLKCDENKKANKNLEIVNINEQLLNELIRVKKEYSMLVDNAFLINKIYINNMLKFKVLEINGNYKLKESNEEIFLIVVSITENFVNVDSNKIIKDLMEDEKKGNYLKLFISKDKKDYFSEGEEYLYHYDSAFMEKVYLEDKIIYANNLNELEFVLPLKNDRIDKERLLESQTRNNKSIFCVNLVFNNEEERLKEDSSIDEFKEWLKKVKSIDSQSQYSVIEIVDIRDGKVIEKSLSPIS